MNDFSEILEREELRKNAIAPMCHELHMANTGASDPITPERRAELRAKLKERLDNWQASTVAEWAPYDDAIKALIIAVLEEASWESVVS